MPKGRGPWRRAAVLAGCAICTLLLAPAPFASRAEAAAPTVYNKSRAFRIPFNVDPEDRSRITEVFLYVSKDRGLTWTAVGVTAPDEPSFPYRADRDGEYWFAARTKDKRGRMFPPSDMPVEPSLKVVVDSTAPSVVVTPAGRRGSRAGIRWEVQDEHLNLGSLTVEYMAEGSQSEGWRQAPIKRTASGATSWDAGTAAPLLVRVSVEDEAGNRTTIDERLSDGVAANPALASDSRPSSAAPDPISPIAAASPGPAPSGADPELGDPFNAVNPQGAGPALPEAPDAVGSAPPQMPVSDGSAPPVSPMPPMQRASDTSGGSPFLVVGSPRFPLQYEVLDADPGAVALVELWVTRDGGQSWQMAGTDPDLRSPFPVELPGDGRYGLILVVQAANGLGDPRPQPGTPPQSLVEVDTTAPTIQLHSPQIGTGQSVGKILITWTASDAHLEGRPVILSFRPDVPNAIWQQITQPMENLGRYIWTLPPNLPPRFHLKVDVFDSVGNRGTAETTTPVLIDLTRPRSRILGLDPSARNAGPAGGTFR